MSAMSQHPESQVTTQTALMFNFDEGPHEIFYECLTKYVAGAGVALAK
jgi:hypothetical protein